MNSQKERDPTTAAAVRLLFLLCYLLFAWVACRRLGGNLFSLATAKEHLYEWREMFVVLLFAIVSMHIAYLVKRSSGSGGTLSFAGVVVGALIYVQVTIYSLRGPQFLGDWAFTTLPLATIPLALLSQAVFSWQRQRGNELLSNAKVALAHACMAFALGGLLWVTRGSSMLIGKTPVSFVWDVIPIVSSIVAACYVMIPTDTCNGASKNPTTVDASNVAVTR